MLCYIGLGSNLGDRLGFLKKAVCSLRETEGVEILRCSPVYETEPWGVSRGPGQGDYLNCVVEIRSALAADELLGVCKEVEKRLGRKPIRERGQSREIDADILYCNGLVVDKDGLAIPHPKAAERFFVLKPLADLAPDQVDPRTGRDVRTMLASLAASGRWRLINEEIKVENP
jgi:2-amino-4-hydroxy-6-hydroxymethyldihydropteridine diphosphokinase